MSGTVLADTRDELRTAKQAIELANQRADEMNAERPSFAQNSTMHTPKPRAPELMPTACAPSATRPSNARAGRSRQHCYGQPGSNPRRNAQGANSPCDLTAKAEAAELRLRTSGSAPLMKSTTAPSVRGQAERDQAAEAATARGKLQPYAASWRPPKLRTPDCWPP